MLTHTLRSTFSAAEIDARMQLWLIRTAPEQDFRQGLHINGFYAQNSFELKFFYQYEVDTIRFDGPYLVKGSVTQSSNTTIVKYRVVPFIERLQVVTLLVMILGFFLTIHLLAEVGFIPAISLSLFVTTILSVAFIYPNYQATCKTVDEILGSRSSGNSMQS